MPDTQFAQSLGLTARQLSHAKQIVAAIKGMGLSDNQAQRACDIALATALVESNLTVYANGNNPESLRLPHEAIGWDHGSVGIYQQQVGGAKNSTADWGNTWECMDVAHSTRHFVKVLLSRNWRHMGNGEAAQSVQGSAFPDRYQERDAQAIKIRKALWLIPPAKVSTHKPVERKHIPYIVKNGDTMGHIAAMHHIQLGELERANPHAGHPAGNFDNIRPGDKLQIP